MQELKSYHYVWLESHPNRSELWLRNMMADGFHIHHIDGNHSNDSPLNLVLIEGADHFMLHACSRLRFINNKNKKRGKKRIPKRVLKVMEELRLEREQRSMKLNIVGNSMNSD